MCSNRLKQEKGYNPCLKRQCAGYMTVEAALILSIVFMVYLFLIRSFFWMYDRCVLEQDVASLILKCVSVPDSELERSWQQAMEAWDEDKYLWINFQEPTFRKQGWKFKVAGWGENEQLGDCYITYEVWRLCPEDWLRMKRRIERGENER